MNNHNQNKIYKYVNGNTHYNMKTQKLHIYNGIVTSPVIKYEYENNYQKSYTMTGSVYITVVPTYLN